MCIVSGLEIPLHNRSLVKCQRSVITCASRLCRRNFHDASASIACIAMRVRVLLQYLRLQSLQYVNCVREPARQRVVSNAKRQSANGRRKSQVQIAHLLSGVPGTRPALHTLRLAVDRIWRSVMHSFDALAAIRNASNCFAFERTARLTPRESTSHTNSPTEECKGLQPMLLTTTHY